MFITKNTFSDCFVISDFDSELERSNPMHDMLLAVYREDANPETVKPNRSEIDLMTNAMKRPIIHDMKSDEKALFWRYRYYLLQFGAALPKFLHSVDWGSKKEDEEAMKLLMKWSAIEIEDAIYLLSSYTSSNELLGNKRSKRPIHCMIEVRNFAVKSLKRDFSDEKIETVLL
jgi:phosphatidylinositol 3-kinase